MDTIVQLTIGVTMSQEAVDQLRSEMKIEFSTLADIFEGFAAYLIHLQDQVDELRSLCSICCPTPAGRE